ncbi:MAG TPA: glycosyltransferase family 4 protein, partial [Armatimonadota bacterium]|nr:glycosyltransferase family 4 protein [Armatimonadota bacterium]
FLPDNVPVVNIFHSVDAAYADTCVKQLPLRSFLQHRFVWARYEKKSAQKHSVVAVSHRIKRELKRYYEADALDVIPCSIDYARFSPGNRCEARTRLGLSINGGLILYAGSWGYPKGIDLINRLAGELPLGWRIVAAAQRFPSGIPVHESILKLEHVPPTEMVWVYRACNLLVFPSRYEAGPLVTREAMACGLPVITTTAGTGEELQRHSVLGYWVIDCPPTYEPLRERVCALIKDDFLRDTIGKVSREYILEHFSEDAFQTRYRKLIAQLVP